MADVSALMMNLSLMQSALTSVTTQSPTTKLDQAANVKTTSNSSEQDVYAVKGDPLYNEEMDTNTDGVVTNQEMAAYYAKIASDYGGSPPTLANTTSNVVNTSQAANTYMANEATYSAPYTSLIETEA